MATTNTYGKKSARTNKPFEGSLTVTVAGQEVKLEGISMSLNIGFVNGTTEAEKVLLEELVAKSQEGELDVNFQFNLTPAKAKASKESDVEALQQLLNMGKPNPMDMLSVEVAKEEEASKSKNMFLELLNQPSKLED